jgi:hypothetical protein
MSGKQLTRSQVRDMAERGLHDQLVQARRDGRLVDLLAGRDPEAHEDEADHAAADAPTQVTRDELKTMTPEQRVTARKEGRLDQVLGIDP